MISDSTAARHGTRERLGGSAAPLSFARLANATLEAGATSPSSLTLLHPSGLCMSRYYRKYLPANLCLRRPGACLSSLLGLKKLQASSRLLFLDPLHFFLLLFRARLLYYHDVRCFEISLAHSLFCFFCLLLVAAVVR